VFSHGSKQEGQCRQETQPNTECTAVKAATAYAGQATHTRAQSQSPSLTMGVLQPFLLAAALLPKSLLSLPKEKLACWNVCVRHAQGEVHSMDRTPPTYTRHAHNPYNATCDRPQKASGLSSVEAMPSDAGLVNEQATGDACTDSGYEYRGSAGSRAVKCTRCCQLRPMSLCRVPS
jgi:hypothetical protein